MAQNPVPSDLPPSPIAVPLWPILARPVFAKPLLASAVFILVARTLGVDEYGLLASAIGLLTLCGVVMTLGISPAVEREMRATPSEGAISLGTCMAIRTAAAAACFGVIVIVASFPGGSLRTVWWVAGLSLLLRVPLSAFNWLRAGGHGALARRLDHIAFAIGLALRLVLVAANVPALWFAAALGLEATLTGLLLFFYHGKLAPSDEAFGWDLERAKKWIRVGWPSLVPALLAVALVPVNQVLTAWLASPGEAGIFSAAALIYEMIAILLAAALVQRSTGIEEGRLPENGATGPYAGVMLKLCQFAWPIAIAGAAAAPWILHTLFGAEFRSAPTPLRLMSLALLPLAVGLVRAKAWESTPHENRTWSAAAIALGANLIVAAVLIPRFGATGAAVATLCALVLNQIGCTFLWAETRDFAREQLRSLVLADYWKNFRKPTLLPAAPLTESADAVDALTGTEIAPQPVHASSVAALDTDAAASEGSRRPSA